ncbi:hypothetical protein Tco_1337062 [Tanacetum coccineum]
MLPTLPVKNLLLTLRGRLETQQWKFYSHATPRIDKGKGIETESDEDPSKKLVPASTIIRPGPDEPVRFKFMINGKIVYLIEQEIQDYWDKEEKMKKAAEEAKLFAMSRPEVIKVVQEEAEKIGLDPRKIVVLNPEQSLSQTSRRKRKYMELEPKVKLPGLECNRSLPEGVPFVNHMVIEEPEYVIFFIDVFGDQAFQR